ncbi:ribonuclease Z [Candidatus Micrarchaeota archaeon]|nr:ribonuclease Z [Candidatus Micrarchaeota archaeon]
MITVTFLGTSGAIPSARRSMPSIALKYDELFLWDCGEGCQREMMRRGLGYGSVKAIFITHLHLDHFLGIFGLIETIRMNTQRESLLIFAPRGFSRIVEEISPSMGWNPSFLDIREMREGELYRGRDYSILGFRVQHQKRAAFGLAFIEDDKNKFNEAKAKGLGLRGRMFREIQEKGEVVVEGKKVLLSEVSRVRKGLKIVYSGDTIPLDSTAEISLGADLLIHDSTFGEDLKDEAVERGHSTAKEAAKIAKKAKAKRLALTHISGRYNAGGQLEEEAREVFADSFVAQDGMEIEVVPEGKKGTDEKGEKEKPGKSK